MGNSITTYAGVFLGAISVGTLGTSYLQLLFAVLFVEASLFAYRRLSEND